MSGGPAATGNMRTQILTVAVCLLAIISLTFMLRANEHNLSDVEADLGVSYCEVYDVGEPTQHYSSMVYRNTALIVHPTVLDDSSGDGSCKATAHIILRINDNNDSNLGLRIYLNDNRTVFDEFLISTDNHVTFRGYRNVTSADLSGILAIGNAPGEYHITVNISFASGADPGFSLTIVDRE